VCRSYLDKTIALHLNKGRKVTGTLVGYDQFMNVVLGETTEEVTGGDDKNIGMVVSRVDKWRKKGVFCNCYCMLRVMLCLVCNGASGDKQ
jgi:small nuclear ribonucleoprotein G